MCQTDRRPLTSLASFSSCLHSGKLPSFENSLSSLCDATEYCTAGTTTLTEPDPFMTCAVDDKSCLYSTSPSTASIQPFPSQAEQCAGVQNLLTCSSDDIDSVRSTVPVGSWLDSSDVGCSYDAVDYRTVCDTEYSQTVGSGLSAYSTPILSETAIEAYQRSSYQSADWAAGYQSVHSTRSPAADVEDTRDRVSCSHMSATISSDQLPDNEQSSDDWSSGVSAKKSKQVLQRRTEHGRRTTQAASRRASTGSLLYTTTPESVSYLHCVISLSHQY